MDQRQTRVSSPRSTPRWSWKLGELFGIAIRVHVTLLALLIWVVASYALRGAGPEAAVLGVVLVGLVFAVIVMHELGHALVARRYGCVTREILLLPIGGMARMERMPERPLHELLVALAGPAVNVALAGVLALVVVATGSSFDPARAATIGGALASQLLWINVVLAVFNLLPAFPMDGGRVLRALLTLRLGRARATRIASSVGKVLGAGFVLVGLFFNPMLALIGVFVWFAAAHESAAVELRSILSGVTVERAMLRDLEFVDVGDPAKLAADRMLTAGRQLLPATDRGQLVGVITAPVVAAVLSTPGAHETVESIMRRDVPTVAPDDLLESVLEAVAGDGVAFVIDRGALVGLLTAEQVAAYAAFHTPRMSPWSKHGRDARGAQALPALVPPATGLRSSR